MAGVIAISIEKYATRLLCPGYSPEEYGCLLVNSVWGVISGYSWILLAVTMSLVAQFGQNSCCGPRGT
jgi:hypothetical protein